MTGRTDGACISFSMTRKTAAWADGAQVPRVRSVTIDRSADGDAPALESMTAQVDVEDMASVPSGWVRIDAITTGASGTDRHALGCFRLSCTGVDTSAGRMTAKLDGGSVLAPAAEAQMPAGSYCLKGDDAARWAQAALAPLCPSTVAKEASATLAETVVFGDGTTVLQAVWQVLSKVGMLLRVQGDGTVAIGSVASEPMPDVSGTVLADTVSVADGSVSWSRAWEPDTRPNDILTACLPSAGVGGEYRILKQSIELGAGMTISESVVTD